MEEILFVLYTDCLLSLKWTRAALSTLLHSCNDSTAAARSCAFIVPGFKGLDCVMELASYYMEKAFLGFFFFFFFW